MYIIHTYILYCDSETCAIQLPTSVILTGGLYTLTKVTEYSETGYLRDLPQLQQGRDMHGCSYFENDMGSKVFIVVDIDVKVVARIQPSNIYHRSQKFDVSDVPGSWWLQHWAHFLHRAPGGDGHSLGPGWSASHSSQWSPRAQHQREDLDDGREG